MKDENVRAFVAVALSTDVKQELGRVANLLADRVPERSVRWVKPDLMHITLCFLGETAVSKLDAICQMMDEAVQDQAKIRLTLNGTGCFPNAKRPRIVWVGLAGQVSEMAALKRDLDVGLEPLGWELEERPFKPHLTLGRVKDAKKLRGVSWAVDVKKMAVEITAVHLIESQLTRQGPVYTVRHVSKFS